MLIIAETSGIKRRITSRHFASAVFAIETKDVKKLRSETPGGLSTLCRRGNDIPRQANGAILVRLSLAKEFGTLRSKYIKKELI